MEITIMFKMGNCLTGIRSLSAQLLRAAVLPLWLLLAALSVAQEARATMGFEPRATVEQAVDEIVAILTDPALAAPEAREQRHRLVVKEVEKFFDFNEISMRTLGPRWRELSPEQRRDFVEIFKQFLEKNYIDQVDSYSGEKVEIKDQEIREDRRGNRFAMVQTDFMTSAQQRVAVNYKLLERDDRWMVYDVDIEGVSLVRNFRTQFDPYSYDELISRMKRQITTGEGLEP
ncbi:phospholipid-binding protein MlaC [Desulfurivibrio sp. D14AmB]|uniref:MlaC/ttg2D family ABC transporter substrate-binding protein n=1 Tax=Desulfurivibrio sp. D14AmB TaxID=3374370 RepID=UPI00376F3EE4